VRHSKTEDRDSALSDFNRSLNEEGKSDTVKMGKFLLNAGIVPDLIITSSAKRAYETAHSLSDIFNIEEENFRVTKKLYYCSAKTILNQICGVPETVKNLLIVSHNPGISDLSRGLSENRSFYMDNTQVIILTYEIERWSGVGESKPVRFESHSIKGISKISPD
jgi:phosphohistidine phosphatase